MIDLDQYETPEKRYQAWVNNKVQALSWTIQTRRSKDMGSLLRHTFFLEEMEHHFIDSHANPKVRRAFYYLKHYLKHYQYVKIAHRRGALKMLGLIYGELGFDGRKISSAIWK